MMHSHNSVSYHDQMRIRSTIVPIFYYRHLGETIPVSRKEVDIVMSGGCLGVHLPTPPADVAVPEIRVRGLQTLAQLKAFFVDSVDKMS